MPQKTPMDKPASARIEDAVKDNPRSKSGKTRFDQRAKAAVQRNPKPARKS
jgi:hypothetical protein